MTTNKVAASLIERFTITLENADNLNPAQQQMLDEVTHIVTSTLDRLEAASGATGPLALQTDLEQRGGCSPVEGNKVAVHTAPVAYLETDISTVIRRANKYASQVLEQATGDLNGQPLLDFFLPESREAIRQQLDDWQGDGVLEHKVTLSGADGFSLPVLATVIPITGADEQPAGWRWLLQDLTGRATLGRALHNSRQRFHATFEQAAVGIGHVGLDGEWQRVNQRLCQLLGYSAEELLTGRTLWSVIHADDLEKKLAHTARLLAGELSTYTLEMRYLHRDGHPLWVRQTVSLVRDRQNRPLYKIIVLEDAHKQKRAEEALMVALQQTQDLYEISRAIASARKPGDALKALIRSSQLQVATRAAVLVFDEPWEDSPPAHVSVLADWHRDGDAHSLAGDRYDVEAHQFDSLYRRHGPEVVLEGQVREPVQSIFNTPRTDNLILFPLIASGDWYGALAIQYRRGTFSTEALPHIRGLVDQFSAAVYMMRLLVAEKRARRAAERANELKLRLLATISHELRTPLTSIQGFTSTLLADDVTWDAVSQREFIETIDSEAEKLHDLVEQLLDHARIESGTLRVQPERTQFSTVLQIAEPQLQTLTANHRLTLDIPPDLPAIEADPHRLAQVLVNLVSNAAKYAPRRSQIIVSARDEGDGVRVEVCDEGPGIQPADRELIFEAFYQAENSVQNTVSGAGLGLTISKGIIEAQGGRLRVNASPPGKGASLCFTLPAAT